MTLRMTSSTLSLMIYSQSNVCRPTVAFLFARTTMSNWMDRRFEKVGKVRPVVVGVFWMPASVVFVGHRN